MITAGEPQEFIPLGREHLFVHPGDVYLLTDNVPAAPVASGHSLTRDLLKALRGVSLKDQVKEQWFLKQTEKDEWEEEFYWKGNTVVYSKNSGHGKNRVRKMHKSFVMENNVLQVIWSEFRIRSCKPRIADSAIEMEAPNQEVLSGVCIVENSSVSIFAQNGEDYLVTTPFQVLKTWSSKFGIIFERNVAVESRPISKINPPDNLPVIFSLMHPVDDIAPVIFKTKDTVPVINYFCDPSDEIVFCCCNPSLVLTYNRRGYHSIWKLRTTTFKEAEDACSKIHIRSTLNLNTTTPVTKSSLHSSRSMHSKFNRSHASPTNISSPYSSFPSSRIASPANMQTRSYSPSISSLTHMATLSRTQPPSHNSTSSHPQNYTPMSTFSFRSPTSPVNSNTNKFIEPLAPDICFEHVIDFSSYGFIEKASKAFLSTDIVGHSYVCLLLKEKRLLQLIKFEENGINGDWHFGNVSTIPAIDAEPLEALNLIITVDLNCTLSLYTGTVKVSKVHITDIFGQSTESSFSPTHLPSHLFMNTPKRNSLLASTRPPSAVGTGFGDESEVLSPVPMVVEEPLQSGTSILPEEMPFFQIGVVRSVRDGIKNRVTLETSAGYYRLQIPDVSVSNTVQKCLQALKFVLPNDVYINFFVKWYSMRNSPNPSDVNTKKELNSFLGCLLTALGFDADNVIMGNCKRNSSIGPTQVKKQKTHEKGCDEDWLYLVSENLHKQNVEFRVLNELAYFMSTPIDKRQFDKCGILFKNLPEIFCGLHLIYEDCKLDVTCWDDLSQLCSFQCELARELRQYKYLDHYWLDFPEQFTSVSKNIMIPNDELQGFNFPTNFNTAPCIYRQIKSYLTSGTSEIVFPYIPNVTKRLQAINLVYAVLCSLEAPVTSISSCLVKITSPDLVQKDMVDDELLQSCYGIDKHPKKAAVLLLTKLGITVKEINTFPVGVALPIKDAIVKCWHEPSGLWTKNVYDLIGRRDLSSLQVTEKNKIVQQPIVKPKLETKCENSKNGVNKENDDGLNHLDLEVLKLRFGKDHRIHDVYNMLQSSKPVRINLVQRPEVSDHEFIEEQERHLYNLCIRTMAATVGRGMFTLRAYNPVITEALPIPKLCLTGRAPPRNTTVDLSHIDVPSNMNMWPLFHNGVAAGLSISQNASKIDSTWMVYNKPRSSSNDTPTEHAGFLMALGLNGHLSRLTSLSIHDYLCKGHELTSVGILLGVSAAKRGTMDLNATKMLSIHIEALLPPTSTELDVSPAVQVAAVMGLGLLYQGSGHHYMSEVLLGEIGRPPGPEMEHCVDRESYSLSAGLALGLITFGKGKSMSGVADFPIADQLYYYMVGGHKRPLSGIHKEKHKSPSYQIREGDNVNVDVTSPGATLALGMMFFDTDNHAIADWMKAPDTQFLLDMVRPDFLLLRTLSKGLILWSCVHPSICWVESHIPTIVTKYAFQKGQVNADIDYETMSQVYCNITAGGCFCLGLKFAGSANNEAFKTLMHYAKQFINISRKYASDQAGRSTVETCLNVIVLSLAMVMAGTGDLDVIRICRHLRSRVHQASSYVLYGSHVVTHMALGLLFLGGGRFTLNTSPLSIGAMICAFFPKFPQHSNDSRYHLQALYHLYVLAVEPRLIVPRLIDSTKPVYINIKVKFKDEFKNYSVPSSTIHPNPEIFRPGTSRRPTSVLDNGEGSLEVPENADSLDNLIYTLKAPCLLPELKYLDKVIIEDTRYWPIVFDRNENWNILCNLLENGGTLLVMQKAGCLPYNEDPKGYQSLLARSSLWNNVHAWIRKDVQISHFSSDPVGLNFASCFLKSTAKSEKEKEWQQKMCGILFECASLEKMEALPISISIMQMAKLTHFSHHSFEMWQVKLVAAYERWCRNYGNLYNDDLTLLRPDMSIILMSEMEKIVNTLIKDLKQPLYQYLINNFKPVNDVIPTYPAALVAYILFHDYHTASPLNFPFQSDLPFPLLVANFRNSSVSVSSILSLIKVFKS